MRYIGYANMAHIDEHSSKVVKELSDNHCSLVHLERADAEGKPEWGFFIDELKSGDVAVLYSFRNTFLNFYEMMYFLKLCASKGIRIISIHDKLDSSDVMFTSKTAATLAVITDVPNVQVESAYNDLDSEFVAGNKRDKKLKKYKMVINMYNAGFSINDIMNKTGYRGKSNIYRILHAYDVPLEYPSMARQTKNGESSGTTDSKMV